MSSRTNHWEIINQHLNDATLSYLSNILNDSLKASILLRQIYGKNWVDVHYYSKEELFSILFALYMDEKASLKDLEHLGFSDLMISWVSICRFFTFEEVQFIKEKYTSDYDKALTIIGRIYAEKTDRSGNPQSRHLLAVSDALDTTEKKTVGLLHDVVEDGYLTFTALHIFGIHGRIIKAGFVLTRDKEKCKTYDEYIRNQILPSRSLTVQETKEKDMLNNQSLERVKDLPTKEAQEKALTKYKPYIPLVQAREGELKLERKRRK